MKKEEKQESRVTVLGLGAMGARIAHRLIADGYEVTVWNRTASRAEKLVSGGARLAASPREAAAASPIVISMVRDDEASRRVWLGREGAAEGLTNGSMAIETSTLQPAWVRELATELARVGSALVESPVVGSRPQAEAGQLLCLAGGTRRDVDRVRPVLAAFASRVFHLGELGLGAVAKLAVNTFFATQVAAAGELVGFLRRAGIEDERWLDLFANLPIVAPPVAGAMKGMALGQYAPMFPIELVEKDLRYFLNAAVESEAASPLASAVQARFADALEAGHGSDNIHGVVQIYGDSAS